MHEHHVSWNSCLWLVYGATLQWFPALMHLVYAFIHSDFHYRYGPHLLTLTPCCTVYAWWMLHIHALLSTVYFVRLTGHYRTFYRTTYQISKSRLNINGANAATEELPEFSVNPNQTHLNQRTRVFSFSGKCLWSALSIWFLIYASVGFFHLFYDPAVKSVSPDHLQ